MATWTPQTKNSTTFAGQSFTSISEWGDTAFTWGGVVGWGSLKGDVYANQTKNTSVMTNQSKN